MRAYLCWNCRKLVSCLKVFPNGRPRRRSECLEYLEAEAPRISKREMAEILGCSVRKVENLATSLKGVRFLTKALSRKGITLTYEREKNRIYFFREVNGDGR